MFGLQVKEKVSTCGDWCGEVQSRMASNLVGGEASSTRFIETRIVRSMAEGPGGEFVS